MDSIKLRELRICGFGFQWGHDFSAMDSTEERDMYSEDEDTFQWGHDFSAMDSSRAMYLECNIDDVSMGPRLFSHG